jgi:hypothetical protein
MMQNAVHDSLSAIRYPQFANSEIHNPQKKRGGRGCGDEDVAATAGETPALRIRLRAVAASKSRVWFFAACAFA